MLYDVALAMASLDPEVVRVLVDVLGSSKDIFQSDFNQLISAGLKDKYALKLCDKELLVRAKAEIEFCDKYKIDILVRGARSYPDRLGQCSNSPHLLYKMGSLDINDDSRKWVAVVGTRKNSSAGYSCCRKLIEDIADRYPETVIVSGLAYGIDAIAHQTALDCGLKTIAFLAHGLDEIYPKQNRSLAKRILDNGGAMCTEYPRSTQILKPNFLKRNRLVAGVSEAVVVVESPLKSGAISTANIADSYGRELFAMPGRVTDSSFAGCNKLIKSSKANLLENIDDLEYVMGWTPSSKVMLEQGVAKLSLTEQEMSIYNCFRGSEELSLEQIVEMLSIPASECMMHLTTLELSDVVKQVKGKLYIKLK